jgi:putative ABC transport system substrate-binding protein
MHNRRRALLSLGCVPFLAHARPFLAAPGMKRLGVLYMPSKEVIDSVPYDPKPLAAFGWIEGKTFEKVRRYADFNPSKFPEQARELAAARVDVIFCAGVPATRAAQAATKTISICTVVDDPVGNGFAKSLRRPGGNITGLSEGSDEAAEKEIELIKAVLPSVARMAIVGTSSDTVYLEQNSRSLVAAARRAGISVEARHLESPERVEPVLRRLGAGREGVVYLRQVGEKDAAVIAKLAAAKQLSVVSQDEDLLASGVLMSYRLIVADDVQLTAMFDRLLRGLNPAEIPFELPTRSVFGINRNAAAALGIVFPKGFLVRADKVI